MDEDVKVIVVSIDEELSVIERILSNYIVLPEDAIFLKGLRDPISSRSELTNYEAMNKNNLIANKPWHPYLSAYIVRDHIYKCLKTLTRYEELYNSNPTMKSGGTPIYNEVPPGIDVVKLYIEDISDDDLKQINKILDSIKKNMMDKFINEDHVYDICISSQHFVLKNKGHIKAYRFQELLDNMELEETYNG
jgi:translation elongation factor EF-Ts